MFKFVKNLFSRKDKDKADQIAPEEQAKEEIASPLVPSEPVAVPPIDETSLVKKEVVDVPSAQTTVPVTEIIVAPAQEEAEKPILVVEESIPTPAAPAPVEQEPAPVISPVAEQLEETHPEPEPIVEEAAPKKSWFGRLRDGLSRTRENLGKKIVSLFSSHKKIDDDLYEELETILLSADVGIDACDYLLEKVKAQVKRDRLETSDQLQEALKEALIELLTPLECPLTVAEMENHKPFVIMMVGVNGAGKTTTIGKLAKYFQAAGKSVLLAAGDTFRAAAREQLIVWGERNNVTVIAQEKGDPAAVVYDAIQAATARKIDIVLADTAGRLATQHNLMEEIKKVKRVMKKLDETAPHEIILVLDSNTGQNGLSQVKQFDDALGLTGLVLTKLDGTAKGGIIAAIAKTRPVPVRFIGVGEGIDDLRPFVARDFVNALF